MSLATEISSHDLRLNNTDSTKSWNKSNEQERSRWKSKCKGSECGTSKYSLQDSLQVDDRSKLHYQIL